MKKKITKEIVDEYRASVKVMGKTYQSVGKTISEAISKLDVKNCKGRSILVIEYGDKRKERILMPAITYRLFNSKGFSNEVALKQASILFQGI